jgi:hypothetical protein
MYRMKAIACEQRPSDVSDPTSKQDWAELAIEWRAMAYRAARMNRKGVEFIVKQVEPGLWKWQFQIGETVTTGQTHSNLMGMAARRVQQRIDRELRKSRKLA